jgi:membrane-anchored protein YejM (alkaline phosphatase superfamily)
VDPKGDLRNVLDQFDIVMTVLFTLELLIKVVVYGFMFNGEDSYMRNNWNLMDFVIVTFSLISIIFSDVDLEIFKLLRMLRVLRPLRMISRNPGLRIAI